ncbi:MAG: DUF2249 domain-containing protein [Alphaproteobacteria bacterium]|nr:DUF2249 domain-containing protein [Alphaproteobacteria bacterium]
MTAEVTQPLDLRGLDPPEPMRRALEAIEQLDPSGTLEIVTDREPFLLHRELGRRHYGYVKEIRRDGCHTIVSRGFEQDRP